MSFDDHIRQSSRRPHPGCIVRITQGAARGMVGVVQPPCEEFEEYLPVYVRECQGTLWVPPGHYERARI